MTQKELWRIQRHLYHTQNEKDIKALVGKNHLEMTPLEVLNLVKHIE